MADKRIPLVVVAGPTASGKTALGIQLAKRFSGEIVSADSMQIYTGFSVATAKPGPEERQGIPHHLMDFLPPGREFSVADYVTLARETILDIAGRGNLPILVGGTGLYIHSLVDHIQFSEEDAGAALRRRLEKEAEASGQEAMLERLRQVDPDTAERLHPNNLRRIIRALEVYESTGIPMSRRQEESRRTPSPYDPCILGIGFRDRQVLYDRINRRVDAMVRGGLLEEAREALSAPAGKGVMQAIGYKELAPYFSGEIPLSDALERLKQKTRNYAKRQITWFKRDDRIHWIFADEGEESLFDRAVEILAAHGFF